jgi:hypothetical protein
VTETWVSPHEKRFSRKQVRFLISVLSDLRKGYYPPKESADTGYTNSKIIVLRGVHHAIFEDPCIFAAEIEQRLEKCGPDAMIVELIYSQDAADELQLIQHIASIHKLPMITIMRKINKVMDYICGRRKAISYQEYNQHKKRERNRSQ